MADPLVRYRIDDHGVAFVPRLTRQSQRAQ